MTTRDPQVVQTTGNLHHPVSNVRLGQAQDIFDHSTAFDPCNDMFPHYPHRRAQPIQEALSHTQRAALGLFWGWAVSTPPGSEP